MAANTDLEALDQYLKSVHSPDGTMSLSGLDGFLTAIVIGPELIMPSEWLQVIWGKNEPKFESQTQAQTIIRAIMDRYNEIVACFDSDPHQFEPIFRERPNGEMIASDWASGFLDAVALRPTVWDTLKTHLEDGLLMAPLFILGGHKHHGGRVGDADVQKLSSEMPDIQQNCILGIYNFWKDHRDRQKPQPRRERRPRR